MEQLIAPILLTISGIPQFLKLLKNKHSGDISIITYLTTLFAVIILLIKSIEVDNNTLILSNSVSLLFLVLNLSLIIRYRK